MVRKFPIKQFSSEERRETCNKIFKTTLKEGLELAQKFIGLFEVPTLMGGWYFPEVSRDSVHIWSSGRAEIFLAGADAIEIKGKSNRRKRISLVTDGRVVKTECVSGSFALKAEFSMAKVCAIETDSDDVIVDDARSLGLYIDEICCRCNREWVSIDLCYDFRHVLSEKVPSKYVEEMIAATEKRSIDVENLFYEMRGPISEKMSAWLEDHIEEYDVVIGHSVPFSTLVVSQKIAKEHDIPFIALPHYHMEDAFYHWKQYYKALSEADYVIASPHISKAMFYDKIGAKSKLLPGGGIFLEEFDGNSEFLFKNQFDVSEPFVLVLGRKAGGKNYQWVINAVEEINRHGKNLQLVMIGRDDDKLKINSPNVKYLGEQPRDIVLSALKACEFVINMSESESFGIVILEAWLSGKTVIANRGCVAFKELVDDGENGVLSSREELVGKIESLLGNEKIDAMAQKGAMKAQAYSWGNIAKQIERLCDDVQEGRR